MKLPSPLSVIAVTALALASTVAIARAANESADPPAQEASADHHHDEAEDKSAPKEAPKPQPRRKVDPEKRKKFEAERAKYQKRLKDWKNAKKYRGCRFQAPQSFLVRGNFLKNGQLQPAAHQRAVKYRAEKYGILPGFNLDAYSAGTVGEQVVSARFMGLPIQIHERVEPALICVENRIKQQCSKHEKDKYKANGIGGLRVGNTYRGGEISNHLFGIAIDIDSGRNPCCGCVDPWPNHPLCKKKSASVYERTALTRCWIDSFEKYGFYWLGRDKLEDTMHFEFLGNPDRILP
ncbi:MAG: M15 family metallopeptidase [Polyangiaceae bacterium]|nr:M15 family metallopeptidase [Polyangiaceae bacterium]MCW5792351.1 M15 family metallopeptidase [Polyangiaceae bacterium]